METSANIVDITSDNFETDVITASHAKLVMLDFWASWCGPCQALMPVVTKLANEYAGAFCLAKIDIDQNQELASKFAVRGVPTVKFIKQGHVVDEFSGALPESEIRKYLEKHITRESDRLLDEAIARYEAGDTDQAITDIQQISQSDPNNARLPLVYAELMIREEKYDVAGQVLNSLSPDIRQTEQVASMLARIEFASTATGLPDEQDLLNRIGQNNKDSEARLQLSTLYTAQGRYEQAMEQLLELIKYDRQYQDESPRKAMLKIFDMLGDSELVHSYRRKMMASLY